MGDILRFIDVDHINEGMEIGKTITPLIVNLRDDFEYRNTEILEHVDVV